MRHMISGLVAAVAVMAAGPAMACGYTGCAQPQVYVAPVAAYGYSGCNPCGGWGIRERLADPVDQYGYYGHGSQQYYYVNQGPTYSGPGDFAPRRVYREDTVSGYGHRHHYGYRHHGYRHYHHWARRVSYYPSPRHRYGYPVLRRYY